MVAEIKESRQAYKDLSKAPQQILRSYEIWARLVEEHGHFSLRRFPGYHDEALRGELEGYRSSRLNLKWRVIYSVQRGGKIEIVCVERVSAHDYRR